MPRYKCKVDVVYPFEFEVDAIDANEADTLASSFDPMMSPLELPEFRYEVESVTELPETVVPFTYPVLPDDAPQDLKDAYAVFEKYLKASIEINPTHVGSNFDDFLQKEGILNHCTEVAKERIIDDSLNQETNYLLGSLANANHLTESIAQLKAGKVYPRELIRNEKIRKQSDTTKITQKQYDDIQFMYSEYCIGRIGGVRTTQQFAELLNSRYGLNKSRSVYSKIWCGGVDRESLPKGE
jgi:hypothetical protein